MRRETRFVLSHRPYAVDLSTLRGAMREVPGRRFYKGRIDAVWFRRRQGVTVACLGTLWGHQDTEPTDAVEFLTRHDDGRYGGDCDGRWDGSRYWGAQEPDVAAAHLELLRPMLTNFPAVPAGFDGWWTFR